MRTMTAAVLTAALALPAAAQQPPKPGPELEVLKKLIGTWELTMDAGGTKSSGTATYKEALGGLWVFSDVDAELFGSKFQGHGMESYDAQKKKYVSVWADSMGGGVVVTEGDYDPARKTLTMTGTGPGMDGATTRYKSVTTLPDADTIATRMFVGDGKEPAFTIGYKRKK